MAAAIGAASGYDEINLNIGCPSERVKSGAFGACLMLQPKLVGDCVAAMKARVKIPVTVKCRTGVDEQDPEAALGLLAESVIAAGCDALIVHARKAWLKGLSPAEIPRCPAVRARQWRSGFYSQEAKRRRRIRELIRQMRAELDSVDGVMVGRAAYQDPALLLEADAALFGEAAPVVSAAAAVEAFIPYVEARLAEGVPLHAMTRHLLGLFNGLSGARAWRRHLAAETVRPGAGVGTLRAALAPVEPGGARRRVAA